MPIARILRPFIIAMKDAVMIQSIKHKPIISLPTIAINHDPSELFPQIMTINLFLEPFLIMTTQPRPSRLSNLNKIIFLANLPLRYPQKR